MSGRAWHRKSTRRYCIRLLLACRTGKPIKGPITVGSKSFTEQFLLGEITRFVLEDAGFGVVDRLGLAGTMSARQALEAGRIDVYWDVAMGFATDGRIEAFGLVALADDARFFPTYQPAPVVRKPVLDRHAQIAPLLESVAAWLDEAAIRRLNYAVDGRGERPERVALNWLKEVKLMK